MSVFWNVWIIGLTAICLILVCWVLFANRKVALRDDEDPENKTTGHVYDGIEEYDNPLPRWWFKLFVITIIYGVLYLIFYPGLGSFKGLLGWSYKGELEHSQKVALETYNESFGKFSKMPIEELIHENAARKMGMRLFANNCAVCHGADAGGNFGFPDLSDNDWLYGGSPDAIKHSIEHGRAGSMPAWGAILGEDKVQQVSQYIVSLSGDATNNALVEKGKTVYQQSCVACHGAEGQGNIAMGAPNLADDIWLYDGSPEGIAHSIRAGRANVMPMQKDKIRAEKIHLLTAYVYGLSYDYDK